MGLCLYESRFKKVLKKNIQISWEEWGKCSHSGQSRRRVGGASGVKRKLSAAWEVAHRGAAHRGAGCPPIAHGYQNRADLHVQQWRAHGVAVEVWRRHSPLEDPAGVALGQSCSLGRAACCGIEFIHIFFKYTCKPYVYEFKLYIHRHMSFCWKWTVTGIFNYQHIDTVRLKLPFLLYTILLNLEPV